MATYVITGKNNAGEPLVSVNISGINQDQPIVTEIDVVNALRQYLASVSGVSVVVAQRYEQVITIV